MQRDMFESFDKSERVPTFEPTDPHVEPRDASRLRGQNARVLARLRRGPASNAELAAISLKYTSRISDLRKAGFRILCKRGDGLNVYVLEG